MTVGGRSSKNVAHAFQLSCAATVVLGGDP